MGSVRMRIFYGPENPSSPLPPPTSPPRVTVRLGDIGELLADAVSKGRTWVGDFEDDEVTISQDLYDVLMAYRFYRHT